MIILNINNETNNDNNYNNNNNSNNKTYLITVILACYNYNNSNR